MKTEDYEINKSTCAIIPVEKGKIKIIGERDYKLEGCVMDAIEYGCCFYGSSFAGRVEGSKFLLGSFYKLPIIMEEESETIFFPTHSYRHAKCSWIALGKIHEYVKCGYNVKIVFNNGKTLILPVSYDSLETQIFRATKLLLTLKHRKEKNRI